MASQHASTVGTAGSKSSKSMAALNNAVRHATDGFIGILDMFGFEEPKVSSDFYNTIKLKIVKICSTSSVFCRFDNMYAYMRTVLLSF